LNALLKCFVEDISVVLAQLAVTSVADISSDNLFTTAESGKGEAGSRTTATPRITAMTSGEKRK
jgi:hypothetical protein